MDPKSKDEEVVGGLKSPEEVSNSASLELEMGSGGQVKLEEPVAMEGSEGQVKAGNLEGKEDQTFQDLEGLVKDLHVKGDPQGKVMKGELLSKLEEDRMETADRDKAARRIKWKEEVKTELLKREECKRQMASTPLGKATDWKTKAGRMSKMSMEWRNEFKGERTSFLFDEVFPNLFEKTGNEAKVHLVKTCRTVSKVWKSSTESFMLSKFDRGRTELGVKSRDYTICCVPSFERQESVEYFNHWSEEHYLGDNPFFSRRLSIGGPPAEWKNRLGFWKGTETLLRRWGQEIWVAWIVFDKGMTFEAMYEQLVKFLKLMPNLRCLYIFDCPNSLLVTDMMRDLGKDIYGPLKACMARNPLPQLPHLRHLQFRQCVVSIVAQAMLAKYSGTLEYLAIDQSEKAEGEDPRTLVTHGDLTFPQLKIVSFTGSAAPGVYAFDLSRKCPALTNFFYMQSGMKGQEDVLVSFQNLRCLRPIPTLRRLSLLVGPTSGGRILKLSDKQLKSLFLELPQLESFMMNVFNVNLKNLDFLLPCVSLKDITVEYIKNKVIMLRDKAAWVEAINKAFARMQRRADAAPAAPPPPQDELIQFFHYTNRLYESNLWKLFPQLKLVTIGVKSSTKQVAPDEHGWPLTSEKFEKDKHKVYTREGFNKYLGGNGN